MLHTSDRGAIAPGLSAGRNDEALGGEPRASGKRQGNDCSADSTQRTDGCKAFRGLQVAFTLRGHELVRVPVKDGSVRYSAMRWGLVKDLASLEEARAFLVQIGGRP